MGWVGLACYVTAMGTYQRYPTLRYAQDGAPVPDEPSCGAWLKAWMQAWW